MYGEAFRIRAAQLLLVKLPMSCGDLFAKADTFIRVGKHIPR